MGIYKIFYQNDPVLLSLWDLPLSGITSFICSFMVFLPHYITNSMSAGTLSLPLFDAFLVPTVVPSPQEGFYK